MAETDVKALQGQNDVLKAKLIDGSLDRLVNDRRISPAQVPVYRETLIALSIDLAEKQVAMLATNPQLPDLTQPLADQRKKDDPSTKSGGDRLIELAQGYIAAGTTKDMKVAFVMAAKADPKAANEYDKSATLPLQARVSDQKDG